ncbi:NEP1-interacting protein 1-like isoform X2 [Typha angustifolia]|uniref:NEP1-interacting protein 1-like isoform X2 n=1 Tax=Typha angustifolia TaxID=59011 RepID=UPI003C2F2529
MNSFFGGEHSCLSFGLFLQASKRVAFVGLTCILALCGSIIGCISGALKGLSTETGLLHGAGIGAIAGALVSMEVTEALLQGEILSKMDIFDSLLNGKIYREWVSPAMLKAYQWQISATESSYNESSDIFDTNRNSGLPQEIVDGELPEFETSCNECVDPHGEIISCAVCLQDFKEGEYARRMPVCRHFFHTLCIDRWLMGHASCPICRQDI